MSADRSMNQSVLNLPSKGGTSAPESDDGGTRPGKWQVPLISQFNRLVNVEVVIEGRCNCISKRQHWDSSGREIRSSETVPTRLALGSASARRASAEDAWSHRCRVCDAWAAENERKERKKGGGKEAATIRVEMSRVF